MDPSQDLVPVITEPLAVHEATQRFVKDVTELVDAAKSTATLRAYARDWKTYAEWCEGESLPALPATDAVVASFLSYLFKEGVKVKTIERALAGIIYTHRKNGFRWVRSELITEELSGIRKKRAEFGEKIVKKTAITSEMLLSIVGRLGVDLVGLRDRALLTLTFSGCARRSEIVGLNCEDVTLVPEGMIFAPRRTKTDQEGKNTEKGVPHAVNPALCAVRSVQAWTKAASIEHGPLFRPITREGIVRARHLTGKSLAEIVKKAVKNAGFDPTLFAAHSLRSGFMTSAAQKDVPLHLIMIQSGHKSETVARGYIQHATLFTKNAAKGLF